MVHCSNMPLDGAGRSGGTGLEPPLACTCSRAWREMCSAQRGCCCGYHSLEPAPCCLIGSAVWLTAARSSVVESTGSGGGAWLYVLIIIQVVWTHAGVPVMRPAVKLGKSDWSRGLSTHSRFERLSDISRKFHRSLIMSTANQIFFGDRSDVPDLLKSLADYPFSFPAFDDTGKLYFFWCFFKQNRLV